MRIAGVRTLPLLSGDWFDIATIAPSASLSAKPILKGIRMNSLFKFTFLIHYCGSFPASIGMLTNNIINPNVILETMDKNVYYHNMTL